VIIAGEEVVKWGGVRPAVGGGARVPRWGARVRRRIFRCIRSLPEMNNPLIALTILSVLWTRKLPDYIAKQQ